MWCDTFDADLLAVVPGAAEALGETASMRLETYSRLTEGKINHPSCWNTDGGFTAFFWTAPQFRPDASFYTDAPVAECTFLEAVRDEWVHDCAVNVNGQLVWCPPARLMQQLMYDLRGWTVLEGDVREEIHSRVRHSLVQAAEGIQMAVAAGAASRLPGSAADNDSNPF